MDDIQEFWKRRVQAAHTRREWAVNVLRRDREITRSCRRAEEAVLAASNKDVDAVSKAVQSIFAKQWKDRSRGEIAQKSIRGMMRIAIAVCIDEPALVGGNHTFRIFPGLSDGRTVRNQFYKSKNPIKVGDVVISTWFGNDEWMAVFGSGEIEILAETMVRFEGEAEFPLTGIAEQALRQGLQHSQKLVEFCSSAALHERDLTTARSIHASSSSGFIEQRKAVWEQVHLPLDVKINLMEQCERIIGGESQTPESLLLTGPPGTGKTFLCSQIGKMVGWKFYRITPADLKKGFLGQSGQATQQLWADIRRQPSVLMLDECDGIFSKRGSMDSDRLTGEIVQAFLSEWNGVSADVWVIGTTNRPDSIDTAIRSRFAQTINIPLPGKAARRGILEDNIAGTVDEQTLELMASNTQGLSGRVIRQIAGRVASLPLPVSAEGAMQEVRLIRAQLNTRVDGEATWDRLVLREEKLNSLKTVCALLRDADEWAAKGVSIPKGTIVYGAPGTGKTQIARTIANQSGLSFVAASLADVKGTHIGESANLVKALFEKARSAAPAILFLDEIDLIAPSRSSRSKDSFTGEITSQILQEMDGITLHKENVFVLAATNNLDAIDPAILSRFQNQVEIPLPDREGKIRLILQTLEGKPLAFDPHAEAEKIVSKLNGYAGRDIVNMVRRAELRAVQRAVSEGGPEKLAFRLDDILSEATQL